DVGLDSLEHPDSLEPRVHLVDLVGLAGEVVGPEAAGVRSGLAVVGDADVFVSRRAAGERQLLDRVRPVRVPGVTVEEAAEVPALEQAGQRPTGRGVDLSLTLA